MKKNSDPSCWNFIFKKNLKLINTENNVSKSHITTEYCKKCPKTNESLTNNIYGCPYWTFSPQIDEPTDRISVVTSLGSLLHETLTSVKETSNQLNPHGHIV